MATIAAHSAHDCGPHIAYHQPAGVGLLTTVDNLPPSFTEFYDIPNMGTVEWPLDLSVRPSVVVGPMTPPSTPSPIKKRYREDTEQKSEAKFIKSEGSEASEVSETSGATTGVAEVTPSKTIAPACGKKTQPVSKSVKAAAPTKERRAKAVRKLKFDEDTSSPVSGTIIRPFDEISADGGEMLESGDIDPQYNIVEVTEEAKAELAAIANLIGAYSCRLCRSEFEDAFGLASHRCSCIVLLEYRCPECGKRFNCPANLASHRRWHKPKGETGSKKQDSNENERQFPCADCGKLFKRQAYLRKHMLTHEKKTAVIVDNVEKNNDGVQIKNNKIVTRRGAQDEDQLTESSSSSSSSSLSSSSSSSSLSLLSSSSSSSSLSSSASSTSSASSLLSSSSLSSSSSSSSCGQSATSLSPKMRLIQSQFTEEESIAATALAHLRHGSSSVIRHTTAFAV